MSTKVAIVTGSNKGIGYAIVKGLCERFQGDVYLTARDIARGQAAVANLKRLGFNPQFHQLDVTDPQSVERLRDHIKEKYGGIDVLVNNAAIAFKSTATEPFAVQAEETNFVNFFSLASVCKILFPLLRAKSRVVNISSSCGHLSRIPGEEIRKKFSDPNLTESALSDLVRQFIESAKLGTNVATGWGESAYVVSKVAVSALTIIHNKEYGSKNISINSVHPGYVDTDMTSHKGPLTIEQGASAPLYLALDAPESVKGLYLWHNKDIVDWYGSTPSYV